MKVTHVRDRVFTVYIGRPSVFGNPFVIGRDGTRKQVIKKFTRYALNTPRVRDAILALKPNAILGCHCKPKACHGDAIIAIRKQLRRDAHAAAREFTDVSRVSGKSGTREDLHRVSRKSGGHDRPRAKHKRRRDLSGR